MSKEQTLFGLPAFGLNAISIAVSLFIVCVGIRVARGSDLALEVANTKLVTSNSAKKLERLASELEQQAEVIEQKDLAYGDLLETYNRSLKGKVGYERLQNKIEAVEELPSVENVDEIINEIEATEEFLIETVEQ